MLDKTKEAQATSLADLQQELKSLKALLLSRRTDTATPNFSSSSQQQYPASTSSSATPVPAPPASYSPYAASVASVDGQQMTRSPPLSHIANRPPGLPAWQLAGAPTGPSAAAAAAPPSSSSSPKPPSEPAASHPSASAAAPTAATVTPLPDEGVSSSSANGTGAEST
jgi:hypothetical protein